MVLTAWLVLASLAATYWWARHSEFIPSPPQAFWLWLTSLADGHCCESMGRIELYYMLAVSGVFACLCTFIASRLFNFRKKR